MIQPAYQREGITIYHGDCLSIMPTLAGRFDCIVTDPPYGILNLHDGRSTAIRKTKRQMESGKLKNRIMNTADVVWDCRPSDAFFRELIGLCDQYVIWGGNYFGLPATRCVLVWDKMQPWDNFSQVEIAWTGLSRPAQIFRHGRVHMTEKKFHPTQKPIDVIEWSIGFVSGETILDPFLGSGTTAVAAIRTGRKCIGIELERKYVDIAIKRCEAEFERTALIDRVPTYQQQTMEGVA